MLACCRCTELCVHGLLGVDVCSIGFPRHSSHRQPLRHDVQVYDALIEAGADANIADNDGSLPRDVADWAA